jgi:hypothetical protein
MNYMWNYNSIFNDFPIFLNTKYFQKMSFKFLKIFMMKILRNLFIQYYTIQELLSLNI